jgi:hypothetical protein
VGNIHGKKVDLGDEEEKRSRKAIKRREGGPYLQGDKLGTDDDTNDSDR